MRGGESAAGLHEHGEDLAPVARGVAQPVAHGHAVDVLHRDEHLAVGFADVVDGDTLGCASRASARASSRSSVARARIAAQHLQRDPAIELGIVGRVDDAHAARTEPREEDVAAELRRRVASSSRSSGIEGAPSERPRGA